MKFKKMIAAIAAAAMLSGMAAAPAMADTAASGSKVTVNAINTVHNGTADSSATSSPTGSEVNKDGAMRMLVSNVSLTGLTSVTIYAGAKNQCAADVYALTTTELPADGTALTNLSPEGLTKIATGDVKTATNEWGYYNATLEVSGLPENAAAIMVEIKPSATNDKVYCAKLDLNGVCNANDINIDLNNQAGDQWFCLGSVDFTGLESLKITTQTNDEQGNVTESGSFEWNLCATDTVTDKGAIDKSEYEAVYSNEGNKLLAWASSNGPMGKKETILTIPKGKTGTQYIYCWFGGYNEMSSLSFIKFTAEYSTGVTTGTLALGEIFAFKTSDTTPTVYSVDNHNVIYTDRGVTVTAGNNSTTDKYLTQESIGTVTGTVFAGLGDNTNVWRITNTDNSTDARWNGYVTVKSAINEPGKYRINLLGKANNRSFNITYGSNKSVTTAAIGSSGTATEAVSADVDIAAEDITDNSVTFTITGNNDCPNIYAIHIAKAALTQGISAAAWKYTGSDNAYTVESTDSNKLIDKNGGVVFGYSTEITDAAGTAYSTVKMKATPIDTSKPAQTAEKTVASLNLNGGSVVFYIVSSEELNINASSITLE